MTYSNLITQTDLNEVVRLLRELPVIPSELIGKLMDSFVITTLNIQNSFRLQITCPYPYYEPLQSAFRKVGIIEETIEDLNENLCRFSIICNNIQDAAFINNIVNRIVK